MKRDTVALGFVTSANDAVLLRIESASSNDYLEIEIVSSSSSYLNFSINRIIASTENVHFSRFSLIWDENLRL